MEVLGMLAESETPRPPLVSLIIDGVFTKDAEGRLMKVQKHMATGKTRQLRAEPIKWSVVSDWA